MNWAAEFVEVHRPPVLRGLSFGVVARGVTAVAGGADGMADLVFRMVAGLDAPLYGAVIVLGEDMSRSTDRERRRLQRRLAIVFGGPDHALFAGYSARDNLAAAVKSAGRIGKRGERATVDDALHRLDLSEVADAYPNDLSAVQRKRLALARGIALNSPLLVVDAFDRDSGPQEIAALTEVIRDDRTRRGSAALLFVTDAQLGSDLADEVVLLPSP